MFPTTWVFSFDARTQLHVALVILIRSDAVPRQTGALDYCCAFQHAVDLVVEIVIKLSASDSEVTVAAACW